MIHTSSLKLFVKTFFSIIVSHMLRPYQSDAIEKLRNLVKAGKNALFWYSQPAGKTMIAAHIAKTAVDRGHRVGFFAHRVELLRQTKATFERVGIGRVGIIAGAKSLTKTRPRR